MKQKTRFLCLLLAMLLLLPGCQTAAEADTTEKAGSAATEEPDETGSTDADDTTIVLEYSGVFNQEMMQEIPANADLDVASGDADLTLRLSVDQTDCIAAGTISLEGGIVDYAAEGEASTISLESGVTAYLCVADCELSEEDDHCLTFTIYAIPEEDKTYVQVVETPSSEDEDISLRRIYIFGEMFDEMTEITQQAQE
ncbi:MAG: hypothetical protein LIO51_09405 [Clostridiales bacterium]|nr:hypothetical protein [Clostridiales bacterium]